VTTPKPPEVPDDAAAPLAPAEEAALARALRAAYLPAELAPERHAEILRAALDDPFAPASADELRESARRRRGHGAGPARHTGAAPARSRLHPSTLATRVTPARRSPAPSRPR
jgi:hypothetical protein